MSSVEEQVCPLCGHDDHEHLPTWDGRLRCVVCKDDEDMVDCFVEVDEDMYKQRLADHLVNQVLEIQERDELVSDLKLDSHSTA